MVIPELKYVDFECRDQIGWITMNHPEKMNALTFEMAESLTKILNLCSDSEEVRVIILRGANGNFCGGGDIKGMKAKVDHGCTETRPGLRKNNEVKPTYSHGRFIYRICRGISMIQEIKI